MNRKIVGLYQLITGIFGAVLILFSAINKGSNVFQNQQFLIQIIVGILLYGLFAWSGYGLLNHVKNAKRYSMFLQAVQIPYVAISGFLYQFSASSFLAIGLKNSHFAFNSTVEPIAFAINANPGNKSFIMIYIVPVLLLYMLSKIKGR